MTKNACYSVTPLDDGSVLTSGLSKIKLFDKNNELIWSLSGDDLPNVNIYSFTGTHVLENGNIAVANWLGHGAKGKGHQLIEVNRSNEVVWSYKNDEQFSYTNSIMVLP